MTAETLTLTDFLLARIDEDEEQARRGGDPVGWVTFRQSDGSLGYTAVGSWTEEGWLVDGRLVQDEHATAFYDPTRVLAECESKRRIIEAAANIIEPDPARRAALEFVISQLAAVYADHPDYRDEWRP